MQTETVLTFKPESTDEVLTAHAGLALLGEFAQEIGLPPTRCSAGLIGPVSIAVRRRQVQTVATAANGLAYVFFRFLRRPLIR